MGNFLRRCLFWHFHNFFTFSQSVSHFLALSGNRLYADLCMGILWKLSVSASRWTLNWELNSLFDENKPIKSKIFLKIVKSCNRIGTRPCTKKGIKYGVKACWRWFKGWFGLIIIWLHHKYLNFDILRCPLPIFSPIYDLR